MYNDRLRALAVALALDTADTVIQVLMKAERQEREGKKARMKVYILKGDYINPETKERTIELTGGVTSQPSGIR